MIKSENEKMSIRNRLSNEEITSAITVLTGIQEALLADLSPADNEVVSNWLDYVCMLNPCTAMRPDMIIEINNAIFGSSEITDYLLDLTFRFYSVAGSSNSFSQCLVNNLAEALSLDGPVTEYCSIPEELKRSMPVSLYPDSVSLSLWKKVLKLLGFYQPFTVHDILLSNKHLVVVLLLHIANSIRKKIIAEPNVQ